MKSVADTILSAAAERRRRRVTRSELNRLDERSLWDIGMNRADIDIRFG